MHSNVVIRENITKEIKNRVGNALTYKAINDLRCKHRHTIDEHPACFLSELQHPGKFIKWPDDKSFERATGEPWFFWPGYRIGYLDIEADGLKADFGTMLSWAIKQRNGNTVYDVVTKEDLFDRKVRDRRIVESLMKEISNYSILVTYYGTGYDIPFIRTKAMYYDLDDALAYGEAIHHDLYYTVRNKMQLSRNSLNNATSYLGIPGKTPIPHRVWYDAKYGEPDALEYVIEHNIADVEITEALHNELLKHRKWTRRSV